MRYIFYILFFSNIVYSQNYYVTENRDANTISIYYTDVESDVNTLGLTYFYTIGGVADFGIQIQQTLKEPKLFSVNPIFQTSIIPALFNNSNFDLGFGIGLLFEHGKVSDANNEYIIKNFYTHIPYFISYTYRISNLMIQPRFTFDSYIGNSKIEPESGSLSDESFSIGESHTTIRFGLIFMLKEKSYQINIAPEVFLEESDNNFRIGLSLTL